MRLVQTLVGDGHYLLQYVANISAGFVSVLCALEARVPSVGPVLGSLVNRVKCVHPGVAAHAESPAVGGPVARQRLLLQHFRATHSGDDCCPTVLTGAHGKSLSSRGGTGSPSDGREKLQAMSTQHNTTCDRRCFFSPRLQREGGCNTAEGKHNHNSKTAATTNSCIIFQKKHKCVGVCVCVRQNRLDLTT